MNKHVASQMTQATLVRPTDPSDEELLEAYRTHGDRRAFDTLVHRYERELYNYLRRFLGDATAAEDAFQATFLQVHLKCKQFESGRLVRPWLYTIATHQAIDSQRRGRRHKMLSLDRRAAGEESDMGSLLELLTSREAAPAASLEGDERRKWIRQAVAALPETLRSAVTLIFYQGLKYREAAEAQHLPVGTLKSRTHAAILRLAEMWHADHGPRSEMAPHA